MTRMPTEVVDPRWPKVLSLTSHEFRTPLTVLGGYLRMLLKEQAGPVTAPQRRFLEEVEKSSGRLSALVAEISELSVLEDRTARFNTSDLDLRELLRELIEDLPSAERPVKVELDLATGSATIVADLTRLRKALTSVIFAICRELVKSDRTVIREMMRVVDAQKVHWIAISDESRIDELSNAQPSALTTFDEWRGGCGLSLLIARRIVNAHNGRIWSPPVQAPIEPPDEELELERKGRSAGAVIAIPVS